MDAPSSVVPRISVCMAAYNGSLHIEEQIRSILGELGDHDELVIVNDASTDATSALVKGIGDRRIRLIDAESNAGYVRTFERALAEARGEYVFLSDQDDIWIPGRVDLMIRALQGNQMVASNCEHIEGPLGKFHEIRLRAEDSPRKVRNIIGILVGYRLHWGCAMAFRRELLDQVLPFPAHMTESHDQWIALVGNMNRTITYLEANTILHRLHAQNLTPAGMRGLSKILKARIAFAKNIAVAWRRARIAAGQ
jgi:glycosyltransferase involved in cell wall biosynthesis